MKKSLSIILLLVFVGLVAAEIEPLNTIEMSDTFKEPVGMPVTVFIIFMFLAFIAILYAASALTHDAKHQGTHHPHKKK